MLSVRCIRLSHQANRLVITSYSIHYTKLYEVVYHINKYIVVYWLGEIIGCTGLKAFNFIFFQCFGCNRNNGKIFPLIICSYGFHCFVAIHNRHHNIHENQMNSVILFEYFDGLFAIFGRKNISYNFV